VLSGIGLLDGKSATCHPDFTEKVQAGSSISDGNADISPLVTLTHESVTVDGNIITGQGLGATMDFALCIAEILAGKETADRIAAATCYRYR
jgi:4-methyl-5(b-hydroxyethyl)-thiazole monophosphate biosynthesis